MPSPGQSVTEQWLLDHYGALIDSSTTAKILGYRSANALAKARSRGVLPIRMFQLPHRRGWWSTPEALAVYLAGLGHPHVPAGAPSTPQAPAGEPP